ncbi:hypothetical protein DYH09_01670 [bacterium CPR1]|nr:hypothetical protein [bacterium CPR1]
MRFSLAARILISRTSSSGRFKVVFIPSRIPENWISGKTRGRARLAHLGYRLVNVLGEGGNEAVPESTLNADEAVAIKLMRRDLGQDPDYQARFSREIQVCRSLDHPGIVRLIDGGQHEGCLYLVME